MLSSLLSWWRRRHWGSYTPLNHITINTANLDHNFHYLTSLQAGQPIFPVLKSNAYGHGIEILAKMCRKRQPPYVIVDNIPETWQVRKWYTGDILIIGENSAENYRALDHDHCAIAVGSICLIRALIAMNKKFRVHIFVDTGMGREGVFVDEIVQLCHLVRGSKIIIDGIMTHFAMSDQPNHPITQKQVATFHQAVTTMQAEGFHPPWIHCANSGASIRSPDRCTARRAGKALYGYSPFFGHNDQPNWTTTLKPSLERTTTITKVAHYPAGSSISYDATYTTPNDTTLAVFPCGYHEGLPRSGSGKLIAHHPDGLCYQRGRVCMNLSVWEVPASAKIGDTIQLIVPDSNHPSSIIAMAHHATTVPYDILVHMERQLRREAI